MMNKVFYFTVRKLSYNHFKEFRRYRINSGLKTKILMGKQNIKPERKTWNLLMINHVYVEIQKINVI